MFNRILIPLDGSALAEAVLPYASTLASSLRSHLHLLSVVPLASQSALLGMAGSADMATLSQADVEALTSVMDTQVERSRSYLQQVTERLRRQIPGVEVAAEVRRGIPADEIIQYAREKKVDLIAISTHGRSGLGRLVFGSVADKVLRGGGIPVLLIKPDQRGEGEG